MESTEGLPLASNGIIAPAAGHAVKVEVPLPGEHPIGAEAAQPAVGSLIGEALGLPEATVLPAIPPKKAIKPHVRLPLIGHLIDHGILEEDDLLVYRGVQCRVTNHSPDGGKRLIINMEEVSRKDDLYANLELLRSIRTRAGRAPPGGLAGGAAAGTAPPPPSTAGAKVFLFLPNQSSPRQILTAVSTVKLLALWLEQNCPPDFHWGSDQHAYEDMEFQVIKLKGQVLEEPLPLKLLREQFAEDVQWDVDTGRCACQPKVCSESKLVRPSRPAPAAPPLPAAGAPGGAAARPPPGGGFKDRVASGAGASGHARSGGAALRAGDAVRGGGAWAPHAPLFPGPHGPVPMASLSQGGTVSPFLGSGPPLATWSTEGGALGGAPTWATLGTVGHVPVPPEAKRDDVNAASIPMDSRAYDSGASEREATDGHGQTGGMVPSGPYQVEMGLKRPAPRTQPPPPAKRPLPSQLPPSAGHPSVGLPMSQPPPGPTNAHFSAQLAGAPGERTWVLGAEGGAAGVSAAAAGALPPGSGVAAGRGADVHPATQAGPPLPNGVPRAGGAVVKEEIGPEGRGGHTQESSTPGDAFHQQPDGGSAAVGRLGGVDGPPETRPPPGPQPGAGPSGTESGPAQVDTGGGSNASTTGRPGWALRRPGPSLSIPAGGWSPQVNGGAASLPSSGGGPNAWESSWQAVSLGLGMPPLPGSLGLAAVSPFGPARNPQQEAELQQEAARPPFSFDCNAFIAKIRSPEFRERVRRQTALPPAPAAAAPPLSEEAARELEARRRAEEERSRVMPAERAFHFLDSLVERRGEKKDRVRIGKLVAGMRRATEAAQQMREELQKLFVSVSNTLVAAAAGGGAAAGRGVAKKLSSRLVMIVDQDREFVGAMAAAALASAFERQPALLAAVRANADAMRLLREFYGRLGERNLYNAKNGGDDLLVKLGIILTRRPRRLK